MTLEYKTEPVKVYEIDTKPDTAVVEERKRLEEFSDAGDIPTTMEDISEIIKKMRFKHVLVGGVDDADVWRKVEKLDEAYRTLLAFRQEEFGRICARLEQQNKDLRKQLIQLSYDYSNTYQQLEKLKVELEDMKEVKS